MLLNSVRTQCQIYGQRQLSLLGRVTIVNSLILSKVWYSLRMLKPTKRFVENSRGGLAVLNPSLQQLILQKRWLNYLVEPQKYPTFLRPFMLYHVSLLPASSEFPCLVIVDAEYRKSSLIHKDLSIWHFIFVMYDYFGFSELQQVDFLPVQTILQLPLHKLLIGLSDDHWLRRHPKFPANKFLIFDSQQQRLRLRVASEYSSYSLLCASLYQDILMLKTVKLVPKVWPHNTTPSIL
ncbi:Meiotic nuclear division protein 1 [Mucor velutinosus]|uniref:Meiotic nuclear division protein 1 n=1 Tax=Mucor velutinosus TaxID=708070 RepID=A0AAN7HVD8_9FUNG|nr:Meiotic nuclear division protein 1 [Mucor velutinosus]